MSAGGDGGGGLRVYAACGCVGDGGGACVSMRRVGVGVWGRTGVCNNIILLIP